MKILLLSFLIMSSAFADTKVQKNTDTFSDKVKFVQETPVDVIIHFALHAAVYKISKTNPHYEKLRKLIVARKRNGKDVLVVVEIPYMEILSAD
jgi:hypothetical protein